MDLMNLAVTEEKMLHAMLNLKQCKASWAASKKENCWFWNLLTIDLKNSNFAINFYSDYIKKDYHFIVYIILMNCNIFVLK